MYKSLDFLLTLYNFHNLSPYLFKTMYLRSITMYKILFFLPKFMKGVVKSTAVRRSCVMVKSQMARSAL